MAYLIKVIPKPRWICEHSSRSRSQCNIHGTYRKTSWRLYNEGKGGLEHGLCIQTPHSTFLFNSHYQWLLKSTNQRFWYLYLFLKAQKFFKSLHNRRGQEFIKMIFPHLIKLDFLLSAWCFLAICLPWCIQKYVSSQTKQNTQFYCFHIENIHDWAFSKLQTYAIFQPVFFAFVNFTYVDCCTTYANVL